MKFTWDETKHKINLSDIPEVTETQMARATLRVGGQPVSGGKVRVNIFLDAGIIAYFQAQAGKRGYKALINEALKTNVRQPDMESLLRRVIREELNTTAMHASAA